MAAQGQSGRLRNVGHNSGACSCTEVRSSIRTPTNSNNAAWPFTSKYDAVVTKASLLGAPLYRDSTNSELGGGLHDFPSGEQVSNPVCEQVLRLSFALHKYGNLCR